MQKIQFKNLMQRIQTQKPRISLKRKGKSHHNSTLYINKYHSDNHKSFLEQSNQMTFQSAEASKQNQGQNKLSQQGSKGMGSQDRPTFQQMQTRYSMQQLQQNNKLSYPSIEKQQLKEIIAYNKNFFNEKIKLSVKPNQHQFRLPTKTGASVYKNQFLTKSASMDYLNCSSGQNQRRITNSRYDTNFKSSGPFFDITSYSENFQKPNVQKQQKISIEKLQKAQSPRFLQTSYKQEFLNWGAQKISRDLRVRPTSGNLIGGGKFLARTVYQDNYKGAKVCLSKHNPRRNFPIFTDIRNPSSTTYSQSFDQKKGREVMSYKPIQKYQGDGKLRLGGGSQYKRQFIKLVKGNSNTNNNERSWRQLTVQQLQSMMLGT